MRRSLLLALITLAGLPAAAQATPRIVGGTAAPAGKYPFVANISINGAFGCTGTLIAPTWVMTAGHCSSATGVGFPSPLPNVGESYTIVLGTAKASGEGGEEHTVKTDGVHVPASYVATNGNGSDVGLLELTEPSKLTPLKVAAVDERSIWEAGDTVTAAGFGVTEADGDAPDTLQEVDVPVVADATCAAAYDDPTPVLGDAFDPATEVCAGLAEGGKDSCQGDSGGPLMARTGKEMRLVGATSRGQGCAEPGFPGIYARVAEGAMRDFVKGLVPDAFAPEGVSETMTTAPGSNQSTTTMTAPMAEPTTSSSATTPATAPKSCAHRARITFGAQHRVRVSFAGKTIYAARGARITRFRYRLPDGGNAKLRIAVVSRSGKTRVLVRRYADCKLVNVKRIRG